MPRRVGCSRAGLISLQVRQGHSDARGESSGWVGHNAVNATALGELCVSWKRKADCNENCEDTAQIEQTHWVLLQIAASWQDEARIETFQIRDARSIGSVTQLCQPSIFN